MSREIEVWADWQELGSPILMGHLRSSLTRGKEVFSFSYEGEWLASGAARQLDPDLRLFGGPQYLNSRERPNFGLFLDSSPDRWGRLLMQRREAALAREAKRPAPRLLETDNALSFDLALEVASYFRLKQAAAKAILGEVKNAVGTWKKHASDLGIARSEQEIMTAAFEV